jgi:hypothetical protein
MLGLETFQLVLVLIGAGFIAAGLFGLVPVMTSKGATASANTAPAAIVRTRQAESPAKAPRAQVAASSSPKAAPQKTEQAPAPRPHLTPAARFTPFTDIVEGEASKQAASPAAENKQPATAELLATPQAKAPPVTTPVAAPQAKVQPGSQPAPVAAAEPAASAVDTEVVDELFAELFALRSSVGALTSEVREMRAEQRARRIILREVAPQAQPERKQLKTSA